MQTAGPLVVPPALPPRPSPTTPPYQADENSSDSDDTCYSETTPATAYPDSSQASRRPPIFEGVLHQISTKGEVKTVSTFGRYACVCSSAVTIYDLQSGEQLWSLNGTDVKVTAIGYKSTDGRVLWLGSKDGQLWEISMDTPGIVQKRVNVHLTPIVSIYGTKETWTLSEDGKICVWENSLTDVPKTYRVTPNFKAFAVAGQTLWIGRGKQVFVYQPTFSGSSPFLLTPRPLSAPLPSSGKQLGEFTCATYLPGVPDLVFFGHEDGSVSIYSLSKMAAIESINVSIHKICSICGVGQLLWIGLKTGVILVCDVAQSPWIVRKEWKAHDGPVVSMQCSNEALLGSNRILPVASTCADSSVCLWDGLLKHDWMELDMQNHDDQFSTFRNIKIQIVTWNAGAAKPGDLDASSSDSVNLSRSLATSDGSPDVIVFGFQELVQLDKTSVTASKLKAISSFRARSC
jgi:WD40 repeat protein